MRNFDEFTITHVCVAGDQYLDSDVVFGVEDSLIREFRQVPAGATVVGRTIDRPCYHLDYDFALKDAMSAFHPDDSRAVR
jgi:hydroxyquinol 1,2-dioxygenase